MTPPEILFAPFKTQTSGYLNSSLVILPLQLQMVFEKTFMYYLFLYRKLNLINLKCRKKLLLDRRGQRTNIS